MSTVSELRSDFFSTVGRDENLAVILLNWTLPAETLQLWAKASYRVCADGGADRLFRAFPGVVGATRGGGRGEGSEPSVGDGEGGGRQPSVGDGEGGGRRLSVGDAESEGRQPSVGNGGDDGGEASVAGGGGAHLPDAIVGDLDTLSPEVRAFYEGWGVEVVDESHDQDSTDMIKCLRWIRREAMARAHGRGDKGSKDGGGESAGPPTSSLEEGCSRGTLADRGGPPEGGYYAGGPESPRLRDSALTVLVLGALGGRLDHTLGNLSALHANRDVALILLGEGNLARLVPTGRSKISPDLRFEGPGCGLAALDGPAIATTSGLRWDLDATTLASGILVSGSNSMTGSEVLVETDRDLLWMTQCRGA